MHLSSSLISLSFVAGFALQAVATRGVLKSLAKRDETCPDTPAFLCIFIPPGIGASCSSSCDSTTLSSTESCTSNSCVCNSAVISTYASCLQCAANNYVGNDPTIIQPFLDELVDDCSDAGIALSHPTITAGNPSQTESLPGDGSPSSGDGTPLHSGDDGDDEDINTGLAIGAIVGIAIAIPLGSLLIFGLIGLLCANHAKNRRRNMVASYQQVPQLAY